MKRIAVITPTYNEAANIEKLITQIAAVCTKIKDFKFVLVVADDNSPDGTAQMAEKIGKKVKTNNFEVRTIIRKTKDGLGKAYINAFNILLKDNFDFFIQIDADLSHNPKYINDLVEFARQGKDFVSASRYIKGGGIEDWGLHRRLLSLGGNIYTRFFLGSKVTDYTNGLNMFSAKLLKSLKTENLSASGYGFFIELKYQAARLAKNYVQFPMMLVDRTHGKSKMPKNTIIVNLILVPKLRFSRKD